MTIQHRDIPDSELHESKGVSSALPNTAYVANGLGSGTWKKATHGNIYFENISSPYSLTYPATYTKVAPTTTVGGIGNSVTETTTSRLTYVGTQTGVVNCKAFVSFSQASGANRNIRLALYKNGVRINGSVSIVATTTAVIQAITISAHVSLATNDYIEVYAQNDGASGDIAVYCFALVIEPLDY